MSLRGSVRPRRTETNQPIFRIRLPRLARGEARNDKNPVSIKKRDLAGEGASSRKEKMPIFLVAVTDQFIPTHRDDKKSK